MNNIIQFIISKGLDGYFVASAAGFPIFTQGKTLDEVTANIREATELYLEATQGQEENKISNNPSLLINYEIPFNKVYA
jgi:predicted RNase H-like HicB family nuclease